MTKQTNPMITDPASIKFNFAEMTVTMTSKRERNVQARKDKAVRQNSARVAQGWATKTSPLHSRTHIYGNSWPQEQHRGNPVHWLTFVYWCKRLDCWEAVQAGMKIKGTEGKLISTSTYGLVALLAELLHWNRTPQGFQYWNELDTKWIQYCHKHFVKREQST